MNTDKMAAARAARRGKGVSCHLRNENYNENQLTTIKRVLLHGPSFLGVFKRAYSGRSRNAAIRAKCAECSNLQRIEVEQCQVGGCPLWQYRPYQGKESRPATV
jgi:hypothetical protein